MSADLLGEVRYTRRLPAEWEELVDFSRTTLETNDPPERTADNTESLLGRLNCLDNEALEENRYYGLGLVMCGIAKALQNPDARLSAIKKTGTSLFEHWVLQGRLDRPSLQPPDISNLTASSAFGYIARGAGESLPHEVQFLIDGLEAEKGLRAFKLQHPERSQRYKPSRIYTSDGILRTGLAAEDVGDQAAAATSSVFKTALQARHEQRKSTLEVDEQKDSLPPTVVEIINDGGLDMLNLNTIGPRCASLRLDEFRNNIGDFIDADETGAATFRRDRMVPQKDLAPHDTSIDGIAVLHVNRQRCPALYVEGLIEAMIEIIPAATIYADTLAKDRETAYQSQSV